MDRDWAMLADKPLLPMLFLATVFHHSKGRRMSFARGLVDSDPRGREGIVAGVDFICSGNGLQLFSIACSTLADQEAEGGVA